MPLFQLIVVLIIIGVVLWAVNKFGAEFIDGKILKIINIVAVVAVVLWLLSLFFGDWSHLGNIRVGR
jgi:L-asparagine transporter-like permease